MNQPVMIPAPALSLVLMAAGVAMGFESPPLPALEETGQLPANVFENRYLLGVALRGSTGGVGHRPLNLGNISTKIPIKYIPRTYSINEVGLNDLKSGHLLANTSSAIPDPVVPPAGSARRTIISTAARKGRGLGRCREIRLDVIVEPWCYLGRSGHPA